MATGNSNRASAGRYLFKVRRDDQDNLFIADIVQTAGPKLPELDAKLVRAPQGDTNAGLQAGDVTLSGGGAYFSGPKALIAQVRLTLNTAPTVMDEPRMVILETCEADTSCTDPGVTWFRTNGVTDGTEFWGAGLDYYAFADLDNDNGDGFTKNYALRTITALVPTDTTRFDFSVEVSYNAVPGVLDVDNDDDEYNGEVTLNGPPPGADDGDPLSDDHGGDCDEADATVFPGPGGGAVCGGCETSCPISDPENGPFCCADGCTSGTSVETCEGPASCAYASTSSCTYIIACQQDTFGASPDCDISARGSSATVVCSDNSTCDTLLGRGSATVTCDDDATCNLNTNAAGRFSTGQLTCNDSASCTLTCTATLSSCLLYCNGNPDLCRMECGLGQNCLYTCDDGDSFTVVPDGTDVNVVCP